jgi:formylglycine-generating enzyme required for sulfatase activity
MTGTCCSAGLSRGEPKPPVRASRGSRPVRVPDRAVRIDGGRRVRIGEDNSPLPQDGESPSRFVAVKPFAIDRYAVTNAWFAEFVSDTGYRTDAERGPGLAGCALLVAAYRWRVLAPSRRPGFLDCRPCRSSGRARIME